MRKLTARSIFAQGRPGAPREVGTPIDAKPTAQTTHAALAQRGAHPPQGLLRAHVDAVGTHHDDPPAVPVEVLPAVDVAVPLPVVLRVLPAVVLDNQLQIRIAQVEPHLPRAVGVANDQVHHGLRQARQHDQQPQPGLHRGVDAVTDEPRSPSGPASAPSDVGVGRLDELRGGDAPPPHRPVTDDHEVDESHQLRHLQEGPHRAGYPHTSVQHDVGLAGHLMSRDSPPAAALGVRGHADVGQGLVGRTQVPDLAGGVVTGVRTARTYRQRRLGSRHYIHPDVAIDVHAGEDPLEPSAPQVGVTQPMA